MIAQLLRTSKPIPIRQVESVPTAFRLLCLADIHGNTDNLPVKDLPAADMVVIAGDLTQIGIHDQIVLGRVNHWLEQMVERFGVVTYVLGNHDLDVPASYFTQTGAISLEGQTHRFNGVEFSGTRWCYTNPKYGLANAEILEAGFNTTNLKTDRKNFLTLKGDVFVTHSPPYGILDIDSRYCWGSPGLQQRLEQRQPQLLICGHVHQCGGFEQMLGNTRVVNVASGAYLIGLER